MHQRNNRQRDDVGPIENQTASLGRRVRSGVRVLRDEAMEKAGVLGRALAEEANRQVRRPKSRAASQIQGLSSSVDKAARLLRAGKIQRAASYVDMAAGTLEQVSKYLDEHELDEMLEDLGELAKDHGTAVFAGVLLAGIAAGRFFRATTDLDDEGDHDDDDEDARSDSDQEDEWED